MADNLRQKLKLDYKETGARMRPEEVSHRRTHTIALVVPNLPNGGGVTTVADFIYESVSGSENLKVDLISLATSASDPESMRLRHPHSWRRGIQMSSGNWKGRPFKHFGARWTEVEAFRYQPRKILTKLLNQYDLVQVVAGTPAWSNIARDVRPPVALQVATLAAVERVRRQSVERGALGMWRQVMTRLTSRIELEALDCADVVFVENDWMHDFVAERLGTERVVFAPPGVDTSVFSPKSGGDDDTEPYILSVGRFADPRKNVPLLFNAYAAFARQVTSPPSLVLAGKTEPSSEDWSLAETLGIQNRVRFLASVPQDQLVDLYKNAVIFVSSSDEEGFGMAIIEAMASGVPVVSTRSGGPQSIITDGVDGLLVNVGEVDELAHAMQRLYESPAVGREIGAAGRETVEEKYSLQAAGAKFVEKYLELLAGKHGS